MTVIIIPFLHGRSDQQWYDWISPNKKRKREADEVGFCPSFSRCLKKLCSPGVKPLDKKRPYNEIEIDSNNVEIDHNKIASPSKRRKVQPTNTKNGLDINDQDTG